MRHGSSYLLQQLVNMGAPEDGDPSLRKPLVHPPPDQENGQLA
jgi:hypothetical protein